MTWECHVDASPESRYNVISGLNLLTNLVLYLNLSKQVIAGGDIPYEGSMAPIVEMITHDYKKINLTYHVKTE